LDPQQHARRHDPRQVSTNGWNVEGLDERSAEIRRPGLDTLARWPAVA
jgi:hypothetical protein